MKGGFKPRVVKAWAERNEVYVGHANGRIYVYRADAIENGPICNYLFNPNLIRDSFKQRS